MSDSEEAVQPAAHPSTGGKSLASLEQAGQRPRYKSWRKKYRKMKHAFDGVMEDNKALFKSEQKLSAIATRLQEELDGIMELLLDLNSNANVPVEMRFDVTLPRHREQNNIPPDITPEQASQALYEHQVAVKQGQFPALEFQVLKENVEAQLARQDAYPLDRLEHEIPHTTIAAEHGLPEYLRSEDQPGYLTADKEAESLLRLDGSLGDVFSLQKSQEEHAPPVLNLAELTPRELERRVELDNPQSQHNWLATHTNHKTLIGAADVDDGASDASHEQHKPGAARKRNKNLAKTVGDKAVERAREEGASPAPKKLEEMTEEEREEYELSMAEGGAARRRTGDGDTSYRPKGGRSGGKGGKRKRTGEDVVLGSSKKVKTGNGEGGEAGEGQ